RAIERIFSRRSKLSSMGVPSFRGFLCPFYYSINWWEGIGFYFTNGRQCAKLKKEKRDGKRLLTFRFGKGYPHEHPDRRKQQIRLQRIRLLHPEEGALRLPAGRVPLGRAGIRQQRGNLRRDHRYPAPPQGPVQLPLRRRAAGGLQAYGRPLFHCLSRRGGKIPAGVGGADSA